MKITMKKILDNLNLYDMDNLIEVELFVKQYEEYRKDIGGYVCDIEIFPSKKFQQTFIAHNLYPTFEIYNTWDFKEDIINDFISEYMNNDDYSNEIFIKRLMKHFPLKTREEKNIN